ncbi:MAG: hypothetical protein J6W35_04710 [Eubacterium sp.]|nr:hypothetical protein [Eubacterium sp.]
MKDLYIKPEVDFKEFDILDVIKTSPSKTEDPGEPTAANGDDDDWSDWY